MKAQELNGTHLGTRITFTENGVSATAQLSRVEHVGQIITDRPAMLVEQEVLGRVWVHLEFLGSMQANVTPNAEVTIHEA